MHKTDLFQASIDYVACYRLPPGMRLRKVYETESRAGWQLDDRQKTFDILLNQGEDGLFWVLTPYADRYFRHRAVDAQGFDLVLQAVKDHEKIHQRT